MVSTIKIWRSALALAATAFCLSINAQQKSDNFAKALEALKDISKEMTEAQAFSVVRDAAANDSNAYAMNVTGLAYMVGKGTVKDSTLAVYWLEQAGTHGYRNAYNNLGMMFKNGKGRGNQDFAKAVHYFQLGVESKSVMCSYALGYMFYKGLGCQQDYTKALSLFEKGVGRDHTPSLYMAGLCYRNGYGTEQNEDKADFLLRRAAALGYSPAIEELERSIPENSFNDAIVDTPESMPSLRTDINDWSLLNGTYTGFLTMYDWSGKHIVGEKTMKMTVSNLGKEASGVFVIGEDTIPFTGVINQDGKILFKKGNIHLKERYLTNKTPKVDYLFDHAEMDIQNNYVSGRLSLYSTILAEPERPMLMALRKRDVNSGCNAESNVIKVTPNPFEEEMTVAFTMAESGQAAIRIYDQKGINVYAKKLGEMEAGEHTMSITPNLRPGHYVLNITAGKQVLRTIIIKKGGNP